MSAFGGKADMTIALHLSAFDPKRTWMWLGPGWILLRGEKLRVDIRCFCGWPQTYGFSPARWAERIKNGTSTLCLPSRAAAQSVPKRRRLKAARDFRRRSTSLRTRFLLEADQSTRRRTSLKRRARLLSR